ncbi:DNA polymerase III subunit delta' [Candidatus Accumulibacter phosphatis]|jgi:DNA polymerase-3 subunit delta'|uniref:DNA polymerase III subunit delta' n=1 Tax=Candidatus Accumulibacter phosphatis TaxID=327160 RepID=A0ABX1TZZ5_9PROT|nr:MULTISPECIES: DNA polymerase III subunit delta' [Candidatus Accumulibacter]NMQ28218.1 DNA polymerase III subunit delta' [Candidatus Accumulibacter phosphatis]
MNIIEMHSQSWQQLCERRAQLPHALLIAGQRGIGKFELARSFAASLLCEARTESGSACGRCLACGWLAQGNHPDLRLLQPGALAEGEEAEAAAGDAAGRKKASQQITIDQVRALDDFLHVGTHRHGARVVLLNPAEAMNRPTANAILKALEEPIAGTLFILVSSEPHRLLPTIRSRCQTIPMRPPPTARAIAWLRHAGVRDGEQWLALAAGSPLLALELSAKGERVLLDSLLGQVAHGKGLNAVVAAAIVDKAVKAEKRPAPLKRTLEWAQKWLFDLTLASQGLPPRYFVAHAPQLLRLAQGTDTRKLLAFNRKTIQYKAQCEQPVNSRLFLEEFFLNYIRLF